MVEKMLLVCISLACACWFITTTTKATATAAAETMTITRQGQGQGFSKATAFTPSSCVVRSSNSRRVSLPPVVVVGYSSVSKSQRQGAAFCSTRLPLPSSSSSSSLSLPRCCLSLSSSPLESVSSNDSSNGSGSGRSGSDKWGTTRGKTTMTMTTTTKKKKHRVNTSKKNGGGRESYLRLAIEAEASLRQRIQAQEEEEEEAMESSGNATIAATTRRRRRRRVDFEDFCSVVKAWGLVVMNGNEETTTTTTTTTRDKDWVAQRVEDLWRQSPPPPPLPQAQAAAARSLNLVLKAWMHNPIQVERVLILAEQAYLQGRSVMGPDRVSFTTLLKSWQRQGPKATPNTFRSWQTATTTTQTDNDDNDDDDKDNDENQKTTTTTTTTTTTNEHNDERIWRLLDRMDAQYAAGNKAAKPDLMAINVALHSLSSLSAMRQLWTRMVDVYHLQPDAFSYNTFLAKCAVVQGSTTMEGAQQAHLLYNQMTVVMEPDVYSLNSVLNAYAAASSSSSSCCPSMASHAERFLRHAQERYNQGLSSVCPDVTSYNTVLKAWAAAAAAPAVPAPAAFQGEDPEKDSRTAETAGAAAEVAAQHAEQLLLDMPICPNVISYNTVLLAWARAAPHSPEAPYRAEQLLRSMLNNNHHHDRRGGGGDDDDDDDGGGCPPVRPDLRSFSTVMNGWSKSLHFDKASKARRLLELLHEWLPASNKKNKNSSVNDWTFVYGALLNACAYTNPHGPFKEEALHICIQSFSEWRRRYSQKHTNHVLYVGVLRSVRTLMMSQPTKDEDDDDEAEAAPPPLPLPSRQEQLFYRVWQDCCKAGQVSRAVWKQIQASNSPHVAQLVWEEIQKGRGWGVGGGYSSSTTTTAVTDTQSIEWDELPHAWKCRVRESNRTF